MVDLKHGSLNTCNITTWWKYSWKATNYVILKLWGEKWQNKQHKTKTGKTQTMLYMNTKVLIIIKRKDWVKNKLLGKMRRCTIDCSVAIAATYTMGSISWISLNLVNLLFFGQMDWAPAITEQGAAITGQRGDYGRLVCKVIGPRKWRTRWDYFLFLKIVE